MTDTGTVTVKNPATGEVRKQFTPHTKAQAEQIINVAHHAFDTWKNTPFQQRKDVILEMADLLESNKDELAALITAEMGKPVNQAKGEIDVSVAVCRYTAETGLDFLKDEERPIEGGTGIISYEPIGVILAMQPWNFPIYQVIRYSAANLLAGNTTVLKHAEICWDAAEKVQQLYTKAGLPEGAFGVIHVDNETVDTLIAHQHVRGVTLTGSAAAGKIVAKEAGAHLKKTVLELGGSDPYIILEDAPLENIVSVCVKGRINNAGQTCVAAKRFIVVAEIYDKFKEKFVAAMKDVSFGDPTQEDTAMGPIAREDLRDTLHEQVQKSLKNGATCLTGGELPSDVKGYFYPATVLENVKPGMPAYDEELFGPVASLIKAKDEEDAVRIANDHVYGLGGGVFTANQARGIDIARKIDTGMVNVNGYGTARSNMPFGGVKESGYGREHGGFGIREFVNIKSIFVTE